MYKPTLTDADLERQKVEREQADRLYNDALTALDRAIVAPGPLLSAEARPDTSGLERLTGSWQIVPVEPVSYSGWRRRLAAFVWRTVGPMLQRQQEFNASVVEQMKRQAAWADEAADSVRGLAGAVETELARLSNLQSRLIEYAQQITLYVDTKDRDAAGLLWHELRARTEGLAAGLSALGDQLLKEREHGRAYEQHLEARLLEGLAGRSGAAADRALPGRPTSLDRRTTGTPEPSAATGAGQLAGEAQSRTYASFEDAYRGTREEIVERMAEYVPLFAGADNVLDIGCGRGELLLALGEQGIAAKGIDINPEMVARCRAQGLEVSQGEALAVLDTIPDASLGGLVAMQVVEHLEPSHLLRLLDLAHAKLRPGARIVLETINAACWAAFFSSYIRDITHVRPLHPDTLRFLLVARGFRNVDIRYSSPYPREAKLRPLPLTLLAQGHELAPLIETFNRNVEILNGQLFTSLDYAAVGQKE